MKKKIWKLPLIFTFMRFTSNQQLSLWIKWRSYYISITVSSLFAELLGQETAKEPCGFRVKLPPATRLPLADGFSTLSLKCWTPSREAVNTYFKGFGLTRHGNRTRSLPLGRQTFYALGHLIGYIEGIGRIEGKLMREKSPSRFLPLR